MSIENLRLHGNFDEYEAVRTETEKQLVPIDGRLFDNYKNSPEIQTIEQLYLSQPDEPYSLRLRETLTTTGVEYTATLKDRGQVSPQGLERMEIETPISADTYAYYKSRNVYPALRRLRMPLTTGVTVDWCEGYEAPIVEIEDIDTNPEAQAFYNNHRSALIDKSGSPELSSEIMAHALSPNRMPATPEEISAHEILAQIMALRNQGVSPLITSISGRSGSGKSTVTNEILGLVPPHLDALRLSTDDYHRGKTWLESTYGAPWTNWDAPEVYDTGFLASDLQRLSEGKTINARRFDFGLQEPVVTGDILPHELVIVEGIYAGSPDLDTHRHLHIAIPTPLATSVGRRLARDRKEGRLNTSLGKPEDILRYQLETVEPMYQRQQDERNRRV